ncbi:MAG TPA: hypothetical protein VKI41_15350 [Vicinamibacteria bacterium]|nr:hypothetical protein [Vicinamibacteria bacterium]
MTSSPLGVTGARSLPVFAADPPRDALWEHCRNNLGIARLLLHEGRPGPLVATACRMAVESACRAALAQAGLPFDGNAERGFARLAAPRGLWDETRPESTAACLDRAEAVVAWTARYLRHEAPEHSWGY